MDTDSESEGRPAAESAARRQRSATLEAAGRVLAACRPDADASGDDLGHSLRGRLDALEAEGASPSPAELDAVDRDLEQQAHVLRAMLDETPLAQLRSALPAFQEGGPEARRDCLALLDLVLEDEPGLAGRAAAAELIITVLCSEERNGQRSIVRDPVALSEGLRRLCEQRATAAPASARSAQQDLMAAAQRRGDPDLEAVIHALRIRKGELGPALFTPEILRAAVSTNTALWNELRARGGEGGESEAVQASPFGITPPSPAAREAAPVAPRDGAGEAATRPSWVGPAPQSPDAGPSGTWGSWDRPGWMDRDPGFDAAAPLAPGAGPLPLPPAPSSAAPPTAHPEPHRPSRLRLLAATAAVLAVAAFVWMTWRPSTVQTYSQVQLHSIAPQLTSGYRDRFGSGPLFIGRVDRHWQQLSSAERMTRANQIVDHLTSSGVQEVLIFDGAHRVAVHYADGLPLQVGP